MSGAVVRALLASAAARPGAARCSVKKMAVNSLGNALAEGGVQLRQRRRPRARPRGRRPSASRPIESLLEESPRHKGLLLAAASGFTQYGYALRPAGRGLRRGDQDLARATALRERARKLYRRALELRPARPGGGLPRLPRPRCAQDPAAALAPHARRSTCPLLFWTAPPGARPSRSRRTTRS